MQGKLTQIVDHKTGQGKNGEWTNIQFLLDTGDQYHPIVALKAKGGVAKEILAMPIGTTLEVMFNLESREYNGKWYTDATVWKAVLLNKGTETTERPTYTEEELTGKPTIISGDDDLPF